MGWDYLRFATLQQTKTKMNLTNLTKRGQRVLLAALRTQRERLEKASVNTPAGPERTNVRADLDTTKELIATLQQ